MKVSARNLIPISNEEFEEVEGQETGNDNEELTKG
jgi:hypothetical protein